MFRMTPAFVALTLTPLVLLVSTCCVDADDGKEKTSAKIRVTLHFPGETRYLEILKSIDKLKSRKDVELSFRTSEEGRGLYAEVSTSELASAKAAAEIVEELLRIGFRKISIEVKKT